MAQTEVPEGMVLVSATELAQLQATVNDLSAALHQIREPYAIAALNTWEVWANMAEDENNPSHQAARNLIRRFKSVQQRFAAINTRIVLPGGLNA